MKPSLGRGLRLSVLSGSVLALKHDTNIMEEEHLFECVVPVLFPV